MTFPRFVFITSKELIGSEYILEVVEPFKVFRVYKFEFGNEQENFVKKYNLFGECAVIEGYNIIICYVGELRQFASVPVLGHNINQSTKDTFENLISFYEQERIQGNETRLKKFRR